MDTTLLIAFLVLYVLALADVWLSQLSRPAKVLWSLTVVFLFVVGLAAWLLTRGSAHGPLDDFPATTDEGEEAPSGGV